MNPYYLSTSIYCQGCSGEYPAELQSETQPHLCADCGAAVDADIAAESARDFRWVSKLWFQRAAIADGLALVKASARDASRAA